MQRISKLVLVVMAMVMLAGLTSCSNSSAKPQLEPTVNQTVGNVPAPPPTSLRITIDSEVPNPVDGTKPLVLTGSVTEAVPGGMQLWLVSQVNDGSFYRTSSRPLNVSDQLKFKTDVASFGSAEEHGTYSTMLYFWLVLEGSMTSRILLDPYDGSDIMFATQPADIRPVGGLPVTYIRR